MALKQWLVQACVSSISMIAYCVWQNKALCWFACSQGLNYGTLASSLPLGKKSISTWRDNDCTTRGGVQGFLFHLCVYSFPGPLQRCHPVLATNWLCYLIHPGDASLATSIGLGDYSNCSFRYNANINIMPSCHTMDKKLCGVSVDAGSDILFSLFLWSYTACGAHGNWI